MHHCLIKPAKFFTIEIWGINFRFKFTTFGTGISVIYEDPGEINDDDFDIQKIKIIIQPDQKDPIIKKPSKQIKFNEKALQQEFLKVFELMNDHCMYVEPKFIPILYNASAFCDDYF